MNRRVFSKSRLVPKMTIGNKIFIAVGLLLLVVMALQGRTTVSVVKPEIEKNVFSNMKKEAASVVDALRDTLAQTEADLTVMRAHKAIENYLTYLTFGDEEAMGEEIDKLEAFLKRVYKAKKQYQRMQLTGGSRPLMQLVDGGRTEQFDQYEQKVILDKLRSSLAAGKADVLHMVKKANGNLALISVGALVVESKVEGLIWIRQSLDKRIEKFFSKLSERGFTGVIKDKGGSLVAYSEGADEKIINGLAKQNLTGWTLVQENFSELGWEVTLGMEEAKAFAVIDELNMTGLIIMSVSVIFALGILRFVVKLLVTRPITLITNRMCDIADGDGDLTVTLKTKGEDEMAELAEAFNVFVGKIHHTVEQVANSTAQVVDSVQTLEHTTVQTTEEMAKQRMDTEQAATATTEMSATVQDVVKNATSTAQTADEARTAADKGKQVVSESIESIHKLAAEVTNAAEVIQALANESENIGAILDVIQGIAEQTNLLALNAAIEAARAGDQGRGFAVVADEVRTLAQRTRTSTKEIQEIIERLQSGAENAVQVMDEGKRQVDTSVEHVRHTNESFESIAEAITSISDMNTQIASATEEQSSVAEEISRNVANISDAASQTALHAKESSQATETLARLASELQSAVNNFKI